MRRRWCDLCRGDAERGEELTKCSSCPRKFHPECIPGWRPGHKKEAGWQCGTCEEEEKQRAEEEEDEAAAAAAAASSSSAGGRKRGRHGGGGISKAEAEAAQRKKVSILNSNDNPAGQPDPDHPSLVFSFARPTDPPTTRWTTPSPTAVHQNETHAQRTAEREHKQLIKERIAAVKRCSAAFRMPPPPP